MGLLDALFGNRRPSNAGAAPVKVECFDRSVQMGPFLGAFEDATMAGRCCRQDSVRSNPGRRHLHSIARGCCEGVEASGPGGAVARRHRDRVRAL